jgi:hypothetical protein
MKVVEGGESCRFVLARKPNEPDQAAREENFIKFSLSSDNKTTTTAPQSLRICGPGRGFGTLFARKGHDTHRGRREDRIAHKLAYYVTPTIKRMPTGGNV